MRPVDDYIQAGQGETVVECVVSMAPRSKKKRKNEKKNTLNAAVTCSYLRYSRINFTVVSLGRFQKPKSQNKLKERRKIIY